MFTDRGFYKINIFKQRLYLATFVRFYLSSATFNTFNIIWNCVLNTGKDRRQHLSRKQRAIIWITLELRTQVSVISALITLSPDAALILKNVTLYRITDHWWLDQTVKNLIAFRRRKFIACHSKPNILNNAGVTWWAKKSHMRVLMSSDKKLTNCSPYFISLQCINDLETKRSYKGKINLKNLKIFKKSTEQFKNYSLIC